VARAGHGVVPSSARALWNDLGANANQGGLVCVHHVRLSLHDEVVCARAFARHVLVQAFVNVHHRYVDANFFLDLKVDKEKDKF
jgi:hypothetical protein